MGDLLADWSNHGLCRVRTLTGKEIELDIEPDYKVCACSYLQLDLSSGNPYTWPEKKKVFTPGTASPG